MDTFTTFNFDPVDIDVPADAEQAGCGKGKGFVMYCVIA